MEGEKKIMINKYRYWDGKKMIDGNSLNLKENELLIDLLNQEGICQFVGIIDINGKEVYEKDYVKVKKILYTNCWRKEIERIEEFTGKIIKFQYSFCIEEYLNDGNIRRHFLYNWNLKDNEDDPDTCFMEVIGHQWEIEKTAKAEELEYIEEEEKEEEILEGQLKIF